MTASQTPACCCPRCGALKNSCPECCHCIPIAVCFRLVDQYGVDVAGSRAPYADGQYTATISCGGGSAEITAKIERDEQGACVWNISSYDLGIDADYEIGYADHQCDSPAITIEGVTLGTCTSDLIISAESFVTPAYVQTEGGCVDYYCSQCKCLCRKVCFEGVVYTWDESAEHWVNEDSEVITISRDEYTGQCEVTVPGFDPKTLAITETCDDWSITFEDGTGTSATLKCWKCECDDGCPDFCVNTGESHSPCTVTETALFYLVSDLPDCCDLVGDLVRHPTLCKWTETSNTCTSSCGSSATLELEIFSDSSATLTFTCGSIVLVWDAVAASYDPLCSSLFVLNAGSSTPPEDCSYPTELCIGPENACCDTQDRAVALPAILHADGAVCDQDPLNAGTPIELSWDLTWDPSNSYWEGSVSVYGGTFTLRIRCNCGTGEGCGDTFDPCYESQSVWSVPCSSGSTPWEGIDGTGACQCDPFELGPGIGTGWDTMQNDCCPVDTLGDGRGITVVE